MSLIDMTELGQSGDHTTGVDHDQAARTARGRRLITDLERAHALAGAHRGEHPDWREVTVLLARMHATLSHDLRSTTRTDGRAVPGAT